MSSPSASSRRAFFSLLYRDGRTPEFAPGYDYLSTMCYLPERGLGLPLARTKVVSRLDDDLLGKASVQGVFLAAS